MYEYTHESNAAKEVCQNRRDVVIPTLMEKRRDFISISVLISMYYQVSPWKQLRGGVKFVQGIPKTPSGKILRRKLRELLTKPTSKL